MVQGASRFSPRRAVGRSQVVRQRILIPPCGGSNPPAPAKQWRLCWRCPGQKNGIRTLVTWPQREHSYAINPSGYSAAGATRVISRISPWHCEHGGGWAKVAPDIVL